MVENDGADAPGEALEATGSASSAAAAMPGAGRFSRGWRSVWLRIRRRPVLAMVAVPALMLLLLGTGLVLFPPNSDSNQGTVVIAIAGPISYHEFPEFVADLRTSRRRVHYVQLAPVVEIAEEGLVKLRAEQAAIIADMQISLRDLRRQDLTGSAGVERLRSVFAGIVDRHIAPEKVSSVMFTKFLVD